MQTFLKNFTIDNNFFLTVKIFAAEKNLFDKN